MFGDLFSIFILILSSQVQFTPLKHTIEIRRVGRCEWSRRQSATIWNSRNSPPAVAVCALHLPCELNSRRLQTVADEIRKLNTLTAIVQFTLPDPTRPDQTVVFRKSQQTCLPDVVTDMLRLHYTRLTAFFPRLPSLRLSLVFANFSEDFLKKF